MNTSQDASGISDLGAIFEGNVCFLPFRSSIWPACAESLDNNLLDPWEFPGSWVQSIELDGYNDGLEPKTPVIDPFLQANTFLGDLDEMIFEPDGYMDLEDIHFTADRHLACPSNEVSGSKSNATGSTLRPARPAVPHTRLPDTGEEMGSALTLYQPGSAARSSEMLLRKFDKHTCGILSLRNGPNENPWRTIVWPLAHDSAPLFHAIHSLTAFHSAKRRPQLKVEGMERMRTSVQLLASGIGDMHIETALATALVLAFSESWDMHISTGSRHLRGARVLVSKALGAARLQDHDSLEGRRTRFLCNSWLYMDVIARLTSAEDTEFDEIDEALWSFVTPKGFTEEIDPLMGCASTLFPIIGRVAGLACKVKTSASTSIHLISQASELKRALELWMPPTSFNHPEDPSCDLTHSLHTAEAYRWATLLYLHQAFPEIPSLSVSQLARKVMICLAIIPVSSRLLIVHIFPLLAAGCEAESQEDRDWVEQRWDAMSQRMQIGNVDRCHEAVKEVWSRRDLAASPEVSDFDFRSLINDDVSVLQLRAEHGAPSPEDIGLSLNDHDDPGDVLGQSPQSQPSNPVLEAPILPEDGIFNLDLESSTWNDLSGGAVGVNQPTEQDTVFERSDTLPGVWPTEPLGSDHCTNKHWASEGLAKAGLGRVLTLVSDTGEELPAERTVRGRLHWAGVMKDWNWEGLSLP